MDLEKYSGKEITPSSAQEVDYDPGTISVGDCIYEVLRAKFAAERTREVGDVTTITVTKKGLKDRTLSEKGFDYYNDSQGSGIKHAGSDLGALGGGSSENCFTVSANSGMGV
jgi:hypothetical protein